MAEQYLLDLEGGDIFASTPDGVFETIDKPKIAVGLADDPVTRVEPEVAPRFDGFLGRTEISGCERERIVRPHDKFAGCIVRHVIILIIDHAGLEAFKNRAHQSRLLVLYGARPAQNWFPSSPSRRVSESRCVA